MKFFTKLIERIEREHSELEGFDKYLPVVSPLAAAIVGIMCLLSQ